MLRSSPSSTTSILRRAARPLRRAARAGRRRTAYALDPLVARVARADVSLFHEFSPPPGGGGHQFLRALRAELRRRGLTVENNRLSRTTRVCLANSFNFDEERLRRALGEGRRVVHRIVGPVGVYRGYDDGTDEHVWSLNRELAAATVFQSWYSLEAFRSLGKEFVDPVVIPNAVDPRIFYPGVQPTLAGRPVRVVMVSWSDNPAKGGPDYAWLDEHLDRGRFELTLVGRSSHTLRHARVLAPVGSRSLAALLREQDVLVTGARHESCSNALLEALACGLPAVYVESGSNGELVGAAGLGYTDVEEVPALLDRLCEELDERRSAIAIPSIGEVAGWYLDALGLGSGQ